MTMDILLLAIGLALVLEGLAYAISPKGMRKALSTILMLPNDKIRVLGLITAFCGAIIVWIFMR